MFLGKPKKRREINFSNSKNLNHSNKTGFKFERRYHQVLAQCYCEINRISAERKRGSCFGRYFVNNYYNYSSKTIRLLIFSGV